VKQIELTQGKVATVDDDDFERLNQQKWYFNQGYAIRRRPGLRGQPGIFMHREILGTPYGMETDHADGNKLNNCKVNLRICNRSQNEANRGKDKDNISGRKGVSWDKYHKKWHAQIVVNSIRKHLGYFTDIEEAAKAYKEAAIEYFVEFARI